MRIEMLDTYRSGGEIFHKGDIRTVPDGFGKFVVSNGFAKDLEGGMPTGTKPTGPKRVKPDDVFTKGI